MDTLSLAILLGLLGSWLMAPIYLVWVVARSIRRQRIPEAAVDGASVEARRRLWGDGDVDFEAYCGMVLAFPAIVLAVSSDCVQARTRSIGWPVLMAVVAMYAVAILAVKGVALPVWARWWPAVFAIVVTSLAVVAAYGDIGQQWRDSMLYGPSLVSATVVGVRLARAVRRRDAGVEIRDDERAFMPGESSFVWPY